MPSRVAARTKNKPGTVPVGMLSAVTNIVPKQAMAPATSVVLEVTVSTPHAALLHVPPESTKVEACDGV